MLLHRSLGLGVKDADGFDGDVLVGCGVVVQVDADLEGVEVDADAAGCDCLGVVGCDECGPSGCVVDTVFDYDIEIGDCAVYDGGDTLEALLATWVPEIHACGDQVAILAVIKLGVVDAL